MIKDNGVRKKAAIYCRVSTEDQEREGTSLQSQQAACLAKAIELGYEITEDTVFIETYSGLTIDRPKLQQLRQAARDGELGVVIAYALDRLSRDPVHCIIIQDDLERNHVKLVLVTEDIDTSDMGKLITHIKGFAAKLEAEKIRERTQRGIRERVKAGRMPSGRRARLYGYTYVSGKGVGEGIRYENKSESNWVKQIFHWFVNEGIGIDRIAYKLRELGVPTPSAKAIWYASEVWRILKNRAYIGETYVFTQTFGEPKKRLPKGSKTRKTGIIWKPQTDWVSIPGATPPIIDSNVFEAAQAQLKRNRERSKRNMKQEYLLSGHMKCRKCGRNYWGFLKRIIWGKKVHPHKYYRCAGKLRMVAPIQCTNHNLNADKLEKLVWAEIERLLQNPAFILSEVERRRAEGRLDGFLQDEYAQVTQRLSELDRQQQELLQWALKGFPSDTVARENEKINKQRVDLRKLEAELKEKLERAKQSDIEVAGLEQFCDLARANLKNFGYEEKRLALDALQVVVWVDEDTVTITGAIPIKDGCINYTRPG
jgi:site-specific DNA recombinase